jgi:hypothetical protein
LGGILEAVMKCFAIPALAASSMLVIALALPRTASSADNADLRDYETPRLEEGLEPDQRIHLQALAAAYAAASTAKYDTAGRVVVLARRGNIVTVSFAPAQSNVYDGQLQVTYDALQHKVIELKAGG